MLIAEPKVNYAFDEDELLASVCRDSFYDFVQNFWSVVVPEAPVWNWHIGLLCNRFQAAMERVFAGLPKLGDEVINISPGTTKPVWEGMPVMMADGTYKSLRHVKVGDRVIGKSGRPCAVTAIHRQGNLRCVRIKTWGGRAVVAALDHPILTTSGWVNAGDVKPGDRLALMHKPQIESKALSKDDEFALAGYLIGDGCLLYRNCSFSNNDPDYIQDFTEVVSRLGFGCRIRDSKQRPGNYRIDLKGLVAYKRKGSPRRWCRRVGIDGLSSKTKHVPDFVWRGTDSQIARFIAAYFHCDGCVSRRSALGGRREGRAVSVKVGSISRRLAKGVQRLLLRLGINFDLRTYVAKRGFVYNRTLKGYKSYVLVARDQDAVAKFAEKIPVTGRKAALLESFRRHRFDEDYLPDRVVEVSEAGVLPCRCLSVPRDSSFVVDGVVVHNSLIFSVMSMPWIWTRMPSAKGIFGSYSYDLALDLSRKARDLVQSDLYLKLFPHVRLRQDQNTKGYFVTEAGGYRYCVGVKGSVTGMHGHVICIDDPIDPNQTMSAADLNTANRWLKETLPSRKVDKRVTPTFLVMQRLHEDDPSALFFKRRNVRKIVLPAELTEGVFPPSLRRHYVGGLMDPIRMPREVLRDAEDDMLGAYPGQYLQDPAPPKGNMFDVTMFRRDFAPTARLDKVVRFWDKASSESANNYTCGVKMGKDINGSFWVLDVVRFRHDSYRRELEIKRTAERDGKSVIIGVEQEGGSGGVESAQNTVRNLAGFKVRIVKVSTSPGSKAQRADPYSSQVNAGNVTLIDGHWNQAYKEELKYFPKSRFKDQVDASSGAFNLLYKRQRRVGGISSLLASNF